MSQPRTAAFLTDVGNLPQVGSTVTKVVVSEAGDTVAFLSFSDGSHDVPVHVYYEDKEGPEATEDSSESEDGLEALWGTFAGQK